MQEEFTEPEGWQSGTLVNSRARQLSYGFVARHDNPVKTLIIAAGLSEFGQKYFETIRYFDQQGYNVYIMDWHGQGESSRYLQDDRDKRHSLGFIHDSEDLLLFKNKIVPAHANTVILSHSMGALPSLILLSYIPGIFSAISMTAPFFGFENPLVRNKESVVAKIPVNLRTEKWLENYVPGGGSWRPRTDPSRKLPPEFFSSDPVRSRLQDEWMRCHPVLQVGDPTLRFVREAAVAHMALRQPGILESMRLPVQIFSAGKEKIVSNAAIFKAVARFPDIQHQLIHDASHEILMERDNLRLPVLNKIHNFFKSCP